MFQDACEQRPSRRPSSASSAASISSWSSQDEGPLSTSTSRRSSVRFFTYSRREQCVNTSSSSNRTCEGMSTEKTRELWRCMLELQQLYGCYNSTRIDLAVNAGEAGIDLMRESTHSSFLLALLFPLPLLPSPCPLSLSQLPYSHVIPRRLLGK